MSIAEAYAPESQLVAVAAADGADFSKQLESDCGFVLGHLLGFIRTAFGISPMDELVKPIVGDWGELEKARDAWTHAGSACGWVGENFTAVPAQSTDGWQGSAGDAFRTRMTSLGGSYAKYADGCTLISQLSEGLVEMAKAVAEGIATIISFIGDIVERLAVEASIPVIGWLAGAADVAVHIKSFWDKIRKGYLLLKKLLEKIKVVVEALQKVVQVLKLLDQVLKAMTVAAKVDAGAATGDAATKDFGTGSG